MDAREAYAAGRTALDRGDWVAARDAFQASWDDAPWADALDGLGRSLWWLDQPAAALDARSRAYALHRRDGRDRDAAGIALWLAREYQNLYGNLGMAGGWLSRARSLLADLDDSAGLGGWLLLVEAEHEGVRQTDLDRVERALGVARAGHDVDLEILALSRRGAARVCRAEVSAGVDDLNEAMVAATSGEGEDVQYLGEALCTLLEVAGWLGDRSLTEPWAQLLVDFRTTYAFGPLVPFEVAPAQDLISAFCTACCGGVYLVTGRLDQAEDHLIRAAGRMASTGQRCRCLHPVGQLVDLRVLQGRLEEAEALLTGFEDDWQCATAAAALDLAQGRAAAAAARLSTVIGTLATQPVLAVPLQAQLVDAALAVPDLTLAHAASAGLAATAQVTRTPLHQAQADLARGRLAAHAGDPAAPPLLRSAASRFAESGAPLLAARARVALARALAEQDRAVAVTEARSARLVFDRLGASDDANSTAAFLRGLGDASPSGPRDLGVLSRREREVLALVADGLSNAEIAERLFISVKTAGHHVSAILAKLGLRSRTEAAAFALLRLPRLDETTRPAPRARRR
jgi:DNA-binding NarL/FixJ family response regulator